MVMFDATTNGEKMMTKFTPSWTLVDWRLSRDRNVAEKLQRALGNPSRWGTIYNGACMLPRSRENILRDIEGVIPAQSSVRLIGITDKQFERAIIEYGKPV